MRNIFIKTILLFLIICFPVYGAVDFDGTDDLINMGDIPALDDSTSVSCFAWVWNDNLTQDHHIFGQKFQAAGNDSGIDWKEDDVGSASARTNTYTIFIEETAGAGDSTTVIEGATNAAQANVWQSVAFTATTGSSTGLHLYINGAEDANSPASTSALGNLGGDNSDFTAGTDPDGDGARNGRIGEIACWSSVLTASEILNIHNAKIKRYMLQVQPSNLQGYWSLDDVSEGLSGDGATFRDLTSNNNDGVGDNGANNSGLTGLAEQILTYP